MIPRVLEPEVMDTPSDAHDYNTMDHSAVNRAFAADFISFCPAPSSPILDVGTGTALIPIELCRQHPPKTLLPGGTFRFAALISLVRRSPGSAVRGFSNVGSSGRTTVRPHRVEASLWPRVLRYLNSAPNGSHT